MTEPKWKKRQVTVQMACLRALRIRAFPPATARDIWSVVMMNDLTRKKVSQKTVESRLCELVRFRLAQSVKPKGATYTHYILSDRGFRVLEMGDRGVDIVRQLAVKHSVLEGQRDDDLRDKKTHWKNRIEVECAILSNIIFS